LFHSGIIIKSLKIISLLLAGIKEKQENHVEEYFKMVKAPKKGFIWFENSGHHPMYEERELFDQIIIKKILGKES